MNIKNSLLAATLTLSMPLAQAATTLNIDNFRVNPTYSGSNLFLADTAQGSLSIANPSPALPSNGTNGPNSTTFNFSVTNLTVNGETGHSLSWDVIATASAGHKLAVNGGGFKGFTVTGGTNAGGFIDPARIDFDETIHFAVDNIVFSGSSASFNGFAEGDIFLASLTGNGTVITDFSNNELFLSSTGTTTEYRLGYLDLSFDLDTAAVPVPAPLALFVLGLLGLAGLKNKPKNQIGDGITAQH